MTPEPHELEQELETQRDLQEQFVNYNKTSNEAYKTYDRALRKSEEALTDLDSFNAQTISFLYETAPLDLDNQINMCRFSDGRQATKELQNVWNRLDQNLELMKVLELSDNRKITIPGVVINTEEIGKEISNDVLATKGECDPATYNEESHKFIESMATRLANILDPYFKEVIDREKVNLVFEIRDSEWDGSDWYFNTYVQWLPNSSKWRVYESRMGIHEIEKVDSLKEAIIVGISNLYSFE